MVSGEFETYFSAASRIRFLSVDATIWKLAEPATCPFSPDERARTVKNPAAPAAFKNVLRFNSVIGCGLSSSLGQAGLSFHRVEIDTYRSGATVNPVRHCWQVTHSLTHLTQAFAPLFQ